MHLSLVLLLSFAFLFEAFEDRVIQKRRISNLYHNPTTNPSPYFGTQTAGLAQRFRNPCRNAKPLPYPYFILTLCNIFIYIYFLFF